MGMETHPSDELHQVEPGDPELERYVALRDEHAEGRDDPLHLGARPDARALCQIRVYRRAVRELTRTTLKYPALTVLKTASGDCAPLMIAMHVRYTIAAIVSASDLACRRAHKEVEKEGRTHRTTTSGRRSSCSRRSARRSRARPSGP